MLYSYAIWTVESGYRSQQYKLQSGYALLNHPKKDNKYKVG